MDTLNKGLNYSVLQEIRSCQVGLKKGQRGVLPSPFPLQRMGLELEEACLEYLRPMISEDGLSWVCDPKVAITSFLVHFGYHKIGTRGSPVLVALTGDGLVVYGGNQGCFCGGLKHVDPRLPSQQQAEKYHWFQSKTEYIPLVVCFASEKECIPLMQALDKELLRVETEHTLDAHQAAVLGVDSTEVHIKVVKPTDMSYAWKETGRGGACKCPNAPFFCHLCPAMSKRPSMAHPGPTCPFPELGCQGTCYHMKIASKDSMQSLAERRDEITDLLGEDALKWAYPCCATAPEYKKACEDREIPYRTIPQAQSDLLLSCHEGVVLDKHCAPPACSLSQALPPAIERGLELRNREVGSSEDPKEVLEGLLLLEEEHSEAKGLLAHPSFNNLDPDTRLTDDCIRLICCILHSDMRMGEKILWLLFNKCYETVQGTGAVDRMKRAAEYLTKNAKLGGSFKVRFDDEKDEKPGSKSKKTNKKLEGWSISATKISRVFNLFQQVCGSGEELPLEQREFRPNCPLFHVVDLLFGGIDDADVRQFSADFKLFLVAYTRSLYIMKSPDEYEVDEEGLRPQAIKFQQFADTAFDLHMKLWGDNGMTNYFHLYGCGHMYEFMTKWGNLLRFRNEGAEAFNLDLKCRFLKHTQHGGAKGGKAGTKGAGSARMIEGLAKWLLRRYMWLTGLAWDIVGDADIPGDVQSYLAKMMNPDTAEAGETEEVLGYSSDEEGGSEGEGSAMGVQHAHDVFG